MVGAALDTASWVLVWDSQACGAPAVWEGGCFPSDHSGLAVAEEDRRRGSVLEDDSNLSPPSLMVEQDPEAAAAAAAHPSEGPPDLAIQVFGMLAGAHLAVLGRCPGWADRWTLGRSAGAASAL
jgi:hypothetical protein